ncbi:conserved hypothetical protein [Trichinella spiralis]|uniref:hypothetical protein n=1 Tax=Trichinella spiralis TaxID=6334 RepID=UPI0001EFEC06|nr:conserved hypothetical protein [Trichinella spiralis]
MVGRNRSLHKVDYKEEMVYLFQPPRSTYIPNISPFSLKLETWLRMNEIPYERGDCGKRCGAGWRDVRKGLGWAGGGGTISIYGIHFSDEIPEILGKNVHNFSFITNVLLLLSIAHWQAKFFPVTNSLVECTWVKQFQVVFELLQKLGRMSCILV